MFSPWATIRRDLDIIIGPVAHVVPQLLNRSSGRRWGILRLRLIVGIKVVIPFFSIAMAVAVNGNRAAGRRRYDCSPGSCSRVIRALVQPGKVVSRAFVGLWWWLTCDGQRPLSATK